MRKIFAKLLIMTLIIAVLTLFLCFASLMHNDSYNPFSATETVYDLVEDAGGNTPGAGEYLAIFGTLALGVDLFSAMTFTALIIIIPGFLFLIAAASQLIALLFQIGTEKRGKIITGKIFTYITAALQILVCLTILLNIFCNTAANTFILIGILIFNIIYTVFFIKVQNKIIIPQKTV